VGIVLFAISLLYFVNHEIAKYDVQTKATASFFKTLCEKDTPGNAEKIGLCVENEIADREDYRSDHILTTFSGVLIVHLLLFPLYVFLVNIAIFIYNGYTHKYNFSDMSRYGKLFHVLSGSYFLLVLIFIYIIIDSLFVDMKVPVHHVRKTFSDTFDWSEGAVKGVMVKGVWVKDMPSYYEFNTDTVGENSKNVHSLSSASISCDKRNMTCSHEEVTITRSGGSRFLEMSSVAESAVTSWTSDYVTSSSESSCFTDQYKFDISGEKASWVRIPRESEYCQDPTNEKVNYTLWDGFELHNRMRQGESSRLTKMIVSLIN